jgi:DNA-binding response OmpR family regulator
VRILIAEDDLTSRTVLEGVLKKSGHDVTAVASGVEAWNIMQSPDAPSMAILDWMMPGMDGPEVARRVRGLQSKRHSYIIMLTTKGEKSDIVTALEAGADDYLTKPFDAGELRARVEVGRRTVELQDSLTAKAEELRSALDQIKTLRGIVPICATCKKVRDDQGYWKQVEIYVRDHTEASFSHGVCPECMDKYYPDVPKV